MFVFNNPFLLLSGIHHRHRHSKIQQLPLLFGSLCASARCWARRQTRTRTPCCCAPLNACVRWRLHALKRAKIWRRCPKAPPCGQGAPLTTHPALADPQPDHTHHTHHTHPHCEAGPLPAVLPPRPRRRLGIKFFDISKGVCQY